MPRFSIRFYDEYCTEFIVEAPTAEEAQKIAEEHESDGEVAVLANPRVKEAFPREYVGSGDTMVWRLDERGNMIDEEE